jgi:hypothetical protein
MHMRKPCQWQPVSVSIRSASCEGVGVVLHGTVPAQLLRRDKIQISMRVNNTSMRLPGHIVWSNQSKGGDLDLGIRLDLAFARAEDRRVYSSWVVSQIVALRDVLLAAEKS